MGECSPNAFGPLQPGMKVLYMSGYTDSFIAGQVFLKQGRIAAQTVH